MLSSKATMPSSENIFMSGLTFQSQCSYKEAKESFAAFVHFRTTELDGEDFSKEF